MVVPIKEVETLEAEEFLLMVEGNAVLHVWKHIRFCLHQSKASKLNH